MDRQPLVATAPGMLGADLAYDISRTLSEARNDLHAASPQHRDALKASWAAHLRNMEKTCGDMATEFEGQP